MRGGGLGNGVQALGLALAANAILVVAIVAGVGAGLVALAVAAPVGLALVARPQRGLLALVALTPFHGLLVLLPLPPVAAYWKEALLLATLAATFLAPRAARGRPGRRLPRWAPGLVGFVGLGIASSSLVGGLQALVGLKITFFAILAFVAVWRCPLDARDRDRLVSVLMAVGLLTAVYGLAQQAIGPGRLNAVGYPYDETIRFAGGFMRSFSTFIQPFGFGFFLMVVVLVAVPVILEDPRRPRNQAFLVALPVLGVAVLSTIVRGAWLGLIVGVVYLAVHRYRLLLLLVPVAMVAVLFLPAEAAAPAFSGSSTEERADGWRENLPVVVDRPLGTGIGGTGSAALATARISGGARQTYQTDNYYFKVVLELGLVGLWLFLLLLAGIFSETRRTSQRVGGQDGAFLAGAAACIVAIAAACTVATYFEIFPMDLLFWLFAGIAADLGATSLPRSVRISRRVDHVKR